MTISRHNLHSPQNKLPKDNMTSAFVSRSQRADWAEDHKLYRAIHLWLPACQDRHRAKPLWRLRQGR